MYTYKRLLLAILLSFAFHGAKGQLNASFTASATIGCAPLVVNFTNTSTGALSYSWNLGNTTTTTLTNPSTSYVNPGTFTVTLIAYGPNNTQSTTTQTITVLGPPVVNFTASPLAGCPGTTVTFTDQSNLIVPGPGTYFWDFGDGYTSNTQNTTHTYTQPGFYNVSLFVTNSQGCTKSLIQNSYIHIYNPPVINVSANQTFFCHAPATVQFNNNTTGTQPLTYQWEFGTGGTSTATSPSYTYNNTGSYTVTIIATDGNGCKDTVSLNNYINVTEIDAAFTAPATACVYNAVTFTNTSSTHQSRSWDFGDGNTSTNQSPTHTFNTPGVYNVRLIIVNGPCSDTVFHQITIQPQPASDFTISPGIACPPPSALQFNATAPPGSSFLWDFGGGSSTAQNPTYTYNTVGVKTITLEVTGPTGCKDTIVHTDTIYNGFLEIGIEPDSGCAPLSVDFESSLFTTIPYNTSMPYPSPVVSYSWAFGDGGTSTQSQPTYVYVNPGIFYATLTVTTQNGCTFTDTQEVRVGVVPHAEFTVAPLHICYNDSVVFDNLSTNATGYLWIFGDNWQNSNQFEPTYYYYIPGTFTPMLIAYNNGCPDTFISPVTVQVDSPKAIIEAVFTCNPRTLVQFYDSSMGTNSVFWMFGDGQTSTLENPSHNYTNLGTYTVKLATYNIASGCRDTAEMVINLVDPLTDFTAADTAICDDEWTSFSPVVSGTTPSAYQWIFPNIHHTNEFNPNATDTFYTPGIYPITLIITDHNGCKDTTTKLNYMLVAKPDANMITNPGSGCAPLTVQFQDNSTDVPGTFFTNWQFTYGDGNVATITNPNSSHTYVNAGNFNGQVIVTDNVGCKDTAAFSVSSFKPTAAFVASTTFPCRYATVTFTNYSTGSNLTYQWSFGDGGTSTDPAPTYQYTANGTYTVQLIVVDGNGCTDTFTANNYLTVTSPNASFTMDSVAVCPPLVPNIQNSSTGAFFYNWDLGNGNNSTAYNPSVTYVTSGAYPVTLIATNQYGCADTATITATIYGYSGAFNYTPLSGCSPLTVLFEANLSNVPSITWDFNDGTTATVSATDTITHTYTAAGYYIPNLILSDSTGCQTSNTGIDTIKVDSLVMGFDPVAACINSTVQLIDTSKGLFTSTTITSWYWQFHDGVTSNVYNPTHYYGPSGDYPVTLVVTSSTGCTDTLTSFVTIHELPIITACPDTVVCVNDSATLFATGGVSYEWLPDDGSLSCTSCLTPYASPDVVTMYTVEGTDQYGCKNIDSVEVSLKTKTESIAEDAEVCRLDTVELSVTNAQYWSWEPVTGLSNPQIGNPLAFPDSTTVYTVITRDGTCIPDTNIVTVTVNPLPTVEAGPDITITGGGTAQLLATGTNIFALAWTPSSSLSCDSCENPKATPKITTTYMVYAFTDKGCMDTSDIRVYVVCDESQIFIPTVFTPNGDGQNDKFYPRGKGVSLVKTFRIYNRWGELLFERRNFQLNDEMNAWDGMYKSGEPKPDVYVYIMEAVCDTGDPLSLKGDVTIIR